MTTDHDGPVTVHTGRPVLDLDAIRARYDAATEIGRTDADLAEVADYVPDLLAEVERLRATSPATVDSADLLAQLRQAIGDTWAGPDPVSAEDARAILDAVRQVLTARHLAAHPAPATVDPADLRAVILDAASSPTADAPAPAGQPDATGAREPWRATDGYCQATDHDLSTNRPIVCRHERGHRDPHRWAFAAAETGADQ